MPTEFVPILIYMALVLVVAALVLSANRLFGPPRRPTPGKMMAYESGIVPLGNARERFHVLYNLIAMIFLLFDLEIAFIYPWAVIYRTLGWLGFIEMMVFLGIIIIGFVYAWKRGALTWE
jgi:NADH-quinone oxidoreductase subunit A